MPAWVHPRKRSGLPLVHREQVPRSPVHVRRSGKLWTVGFLAQEVLMSVFHSQMWCHSHLNQALITQGGHDFCRFSYDRKKQHFFTIHFTMHCTKYSFSLILWISPFLVLRAFAFSLKGSTLQLLFAYSNYQHHSCYTLRPFLSKNQLCEHKPCAVKTPNLIREPWQVTKRQAHSTGLLSRGMMSTLSKTTQDRWPLTTLLRTTYNLKFMDWLFLKLPTCFSECNWTQGTKVFEICCVFHTHGTSSSGLTAFQEQRAHVVLVATAWEVKDMGCLLLVHHPKLYGEHTS